MVGGCSRFHQNFRALVIIRDLMHGGYNFQGSHGEIPPIPIPHQKKVWIKDNSLGRVTLI